MMDDIYYINFSTESGNIICLCKDKLICNKEERVNCKEYILTFTEIVRRSKKKFDVDKAAITKLKRVRTELEKTLKKVKI